MWTLVSFLSCPCKFSIQLTAQRIPYLPRVSPTRAAFHCLNNYVEAVMVLCVLLCNFRLTKNDLICAKTCTRYLPVKMDIFPIILQCTIVLAADGHVILANR